MTLLYYNRDSYTIAIIIIVIYSTGKMERSAIVWINIIPYCSVSTGSVGHQCLLNTSSHSCALYTELKCEYVYS